MLITQAEIDDAAVVLAPVMRRTPMVASRVLSERSGSDVWLKCENLQRTGSFKPVSYTHLTLPTKRIV